MSSLPLIAPVYCWVVHLINEHNQNAFMPVFASMACSLVCPPFSQIQFQTLLSWQRSPVPRNEQLILTFKYTLRQYNIFLFSFIRSILQENRSEWVSHSVCPTLCDPIWPDKGSHCPRDSVGKNVGWALPSPGHLPDPALQVDCFIVSIYIYFWICHNV